MTILPPAASTGRQLAVTAAFLEALNVGSSDASWRVDALCAQTDPEAFYPEKGGTTSQAKSICRCCTVRAGCLAEALERDERFGIWGGMSERERRRTATTLRAMR